MLLMYFIHACIALRSVDAAPCIKTHTHAVLFRKNTVGSRRAGQSWTVKKAQKGKGKKQEKDNRDIDNRSAHNRNMDNLKMRNKLMTKLGKMGLMKDSNCLE